MLRILVSPLRPPLDPPLYHISLGPRVADPGDSPSTPTAHYSFPPPLHPFLPPLHPFQPPLCLFAPCLSIVRRPRASSAVSWYRRYLGIGGIL
eukprot:9484902-Pyramimonas_sp.AAC.1